MKKRIDVKTVDEFYQKLLEGYYFDDIEFDENRATELFNYIKSQPDGEIKYYGLGECYYLLQDYKSSLYWLKKAANLGNKKALESFYYFLDMFLVEEKESDEWLENEARQGNEYAQYYLGYLYCGDDLYNEDYDKAIYWLEKAANQGNADAINLLNKIKNKKEK